MIKNLISVYRHTDFCVCQVSNYKMASLAVISCVGCGQDITVLTLKGIEICVVKRLGMYYSPVLS